MKHLISNFLGDDMAKNQNVSVDGEVKTHRYDPECQCEFCQDINEHHSECNCEYHIGRIMEVCHTCGAVVGAGCPHGGY